MRSSFATIAVAVLLILLVTHHPTRDASAEPVQASFDTFYLAVGNSHYSSDSDPSGFKNLPGANKSARRMAEYFDRAGAIAGITLVSENGRFVTKADVQKALNDLLQRIKASRARNPLLIFYFCGHGVSEGIGWNHFSIPGDFRVPAQDLNIDTMARHAIYAGDISDAIEAKRVQAMLLLDACYEGKEAQLPESVISAQLAQNLTDAFKVLRHMNEFHGPTVAVFSTKPGSIVKMVADPDDTESALSIGPLARRVLLSFNSAFNSKDPLTIARLLQTLSSSSFDSATKSVITLSKPDKDLALIKYPLSNVDRSEHRTGTGLARTTKPLKVSDSVKSAQRGQLRFHSHRLQPIRVERISNLSCSQHEQPLSV